AEATIRSRRWRQSPAAAAIVNDAARTRTYSKARTDPAAATHTTISHSGATRVAIATTSGMKRRSQYRLTSRPYNAGAVTSAYRPATSSVHTALNQPSVFDGRRRAARASLTGGRDTAAVQTRAPRDRLFPTATQARRAPG